MARTYFERAELVPRIAEIFRQYGYHGASVGIIAKQTGAGRSSLYHFFPGGKDEMADAVLDHISDWFERHVFLPLGEGPAEDALRAMMASVEGYFQSGQRICLVGTFALDDARDRFAGRIKDYFLRWNDAICACLTRNGYAPEQAHRYAFEILAAIQGGITLARATADETAFRVPVTAAVCRALRREG